MTIRKESERSLTDEFSELREYLRPGLTVLDVGCGPGTISLDVAKIIAPGKIVGIDIDANRVEKANDLAKEQGISNASFEVMNAHQLLFDDNAFDLIYSYTVAHFWFDPVKVLLEMERVAKPDSWIINAGIRDDGYSPLYPPCPAFEKVKEARIKLMESRREKYLAGSKQTEFFWDFHAARKCVQWHVEAGIKDVQISGFIENWWVPGKVDKNSFLYHYMSFQDGLQKIISDESVAAGFLDQETVDQAHEEMLEWVEHPQAFMFNPTITAKWRA